MKRRTIVRDMDFTVSDAGESDGRTLAGYAAVFGQDTNIRSFEGNFIEQVAPGAFKKTLSERKPVLQYNHGSDARVGTVPIGVFRSLTEDSHGLAVEAELFDNDTVLPVRQAIAADAINGMSFSFEVVRDEWRDSDGNVVTGRDLQRKLFASNDSDRLHRTIKEVRLREAGPVLYPAYQGTSVGVRSADDLEPQERTAIIHEYCRSAGMAITDLDKDNDGDNDTKTVDSVPDGPLNNESTTGHTDNNDHDFVNGICVSCNPGALDFVSDGKDVGVSDSKPANLDTEEYADGTRPGRSADPKKPYGSVSYADQGYQADKKKRYPIDTAEHVKAALSYIGQADNASQYSEDQLTNIKSKISAAAKKFGITVSETKSSDTPAVVRDTAAVKDIIPSNVVIDTLQRDLKKVDTGAEAPSKKVKIMTLTELRERLASILVRQEELSVEYRDAEMPAAEETEFDGLASERASVESKIAKIEARLETFKAGATSSKQVENGSDTPAYVRSTTEQIFDVDAIRRDSYSEEDLRSRLRDNAMRATEIAKFGGGRLVNREAAQEQIQHFLDDKDDASGTFAKRVLVNGSPAYERAWAKAVAAGNPQALFGEEARALSLGSDGSGGFAVPVQLDPTIILTSTGVIDPLRQIARVEQIVGKEYQVNSSAGVTVTRSAEAAEAADNSFTITQKPVRTERVTGFVPFSYELAESWGQVRSEITTLLVDAKAREEANSFLLGDGTGTNANGLIATLSGNTTTAGGTATFAAADLYNLETALAPRWRANGKFLAHRAIYNKIRQFDTAGGAQLWERVGAGLPSQLLGYDALESSEMATVLTTGTKIAVFGDFSQFLIVDRIGMSVELIPQVFGSSQRPTGQRGIFAIWMNNSKVLVDAAFKVLVTG